MSRHHRASIIVFCTLLLSTFVASALHADIYEWEWVNPADPSQGKQASETKVYPDGIGLDPLSPPLNAENKNLTQGYLEYDLTGSSFRYATLVNADFHAATLFDADFTGAVITSADFSNTTAGGFTWDQLASTLSYANYNLTGVDFRENFMVGWDFDGQNLTDANLASTNLCYASLRGATLANVDFSGAAVVGTDLSATTAYGFTKEQLYTTSSYATFKSLREINLAENNLSQWQLGGLKMVDTVFDSSTMADANLQDSNFRGASFRGAWLAGNETYTAGADFSETSNSIHGSILIDADFSGATLTQETNGNTNFENAIIAGANFSEVTNHDPDYDPSNFRDQIESTTSYASNEMMGVVLAGNTIENWDLQGKDLRGANFDSAEFAGTDFSPDGDDICTDLSGASFRNARLTNTDFSGADLSGASFNNSVAPDPVNPRFDRATFTDATIAGANFSAATNYGFDEDQFHSTASYTTSGDLTGIDLSNNTMDGWDFDGSDTPTEPDINLSNAVFDSSSLIGAEFKGTKLTGASFHDATLDGADFTGATIQDANLSNTTEHGYTPAQLYETKSYDVDKDLSGVDLSNNTMTGWNFAGQKMNDAQLELSKLDGADFTNATLTGASFYNADPTVYVDATFVGTNFTNADLTSARFEKAILDGATLTDATINWANFFGTVARGFTFDQFKETASYKNGNLTGVGLSYNDLTAGWNFSGKIMTDASFYKSTLTGADFSDTRLDCAYFYESDLTGADLSGANLSGANLHLAELTYADFSGAKIDHARMTAATAHGFTEEQFRSTASYARRTIQGICLAYCDLSQNGISGAWDLSYLNLNMADFTYATLGGVNFTNTKIIGANFYGTVDGTLDGFTFDKFKETASYKNGNLTGIGMEYNELGDYGGLVPWDFHGQNLDYARFNDSTLDGATFVGSHARWASFEETSLDRTNFTGALFYCPSFRGAYLTDTNFTNARLTGADFSDAEFYGDLTFDGARIDWANFSGVTDPDNFTSETFRELVYSTASYNDSGNLRGVNLSYNDLSAAWDFVGKNMAYAQFEFSDLTGANFSADGATNTNLTEASFYGATLDGVDFSDADLSGADFEGATLSGTKFDNAVIAHANFWEATYYGLTKEEFEETASWNDKDLTGICLGNNNLMGWDFKEQNLTNADFTWSALLGAEFNEATIIAGANFTATVENGFTFDQFKLTQSYIDGKLSGVVLDDNDLRGWNFTATPSKQMNLARASFRLSTLSGVSFVDADLRKADFTDAVLVDADLSGANLTDANFTDTLLGYATLNGADARGANIRYERAKCSVENFVKPDGHVEGLHITDSFRVWDYDGSLEIIVDSEFSLDDGTLIVSLEDGDWGSTIHFAADISDIVFDGMFEVELRNGYIPVGYQEWQIFDFSGVESMITEEDVFAGFTEALVPGMPWIEWNFDDLLTTGMLSIYSSVTYDINCDGIVDDDDLAILCKNWLKEEDEEGNPVSWEDGNFNPDNIVDDYDLIILITHFGDVYTPPTAVPEPGAIVLLICGVLACLVLRRF